MLLPVLASFAAAITPIAAAPLSMPQHRTVPVRQPISLFAGWRSIVLLT